MPIPATRSVALEVPAGIQTEFRITKAEFDPDGRFGPRFELDLELNEDKYLGTQLKYWSSIQQPRLDLVRKYRKDGMSDKLIAEALRERGHKFKKIDEPDTMTIGRGGNTYKILTAVEGSIPGAEAALQECDSFEALAKRLVGGTFVGTTKKSSDGKYIQLNGEEEIYPVASAVLTDTGDEDGEDTDPVDKFAKDIPFE